MKTLGIRHIALKVKDAQASKDFYCKYLGMHVEWEPDPQNIYLTTESHDNLALHQEENFVLDKKQCGLDHFGYIAVSKDDVDECFQHLQNAKILIAKEPKQHRDGAYSFYFHDPDGYVIQMIYHPPIVQAIK